MESELSRESRHTLSLLVDNEPGVLARVVSLLSARGFNIEALTVSETEHDEQVSRITIVTCASPRVAAKIVAQLERLVPVRVVVNVGDLGAFIERDLALIKVVNEKEERSEALRLADAFRARIIDATPRSLTMEIAGTCREIESFIALMRPLGLADVTRTGVTAINRGDQPMFSAMGG